jgi:hypothetical protein
MSALETDAEPAEALALVKLALVVDHVGRGARAWTHATEGAGNAATVGGWVKLEGQGGHAPLALELFP